MFRHALETTERVTFVIIGHEGHIEIVPNDIITWFRIKDYPIKVFRTIIVGYIEKGIIQFYLADGHKETTGSPFSVSYAQYLEITKLYRYKFGPAKVDVYDGLRANWRGVITGPVLKLAEINIK